MQSDNSTTLTDLGSPILITGTQRSGTTLLYRILVASRKIFCWNEMFFVHQAMFAADSKKRMAKHEFAEKLRQRLKLDSPLSDTSKTDAFRQGMMLAAQQAGSDRWCLKDPHLSYYLPDYADAFPNAKFVILVRDGRAVCRSYLDTSTFSLGRPSNPVAAADKWCREVELQLEFMSAYPGRFLCVKYEDLVSNFRSRIQEVSEYLDLDAVGEMLRYHEDSASGTRIHAGNKNVLTPPDKERIDTWKASLTTQEVREFEFIASHTLRSLGYETESNPGRIAALRLWYRRLSDRIIQEIRWQKYKRESKNV